MAETIVTQNSVISGIESQKDVVVLILAASRTDETGARVPITDAQKETAMNAAKAVLQCVGAEVAANSTAWILPAVELAEGETLALNVGVADSDGPTGGVAQWRPCILRTTLDSGDGRSERRFRGGVGRHRYLL